MVHCSNRNHHTAEGDRRSSEVLSNDDKEDDDKEDDDKEDDDKEDEKLVRVNSSCVRVKEQI